MARLFIDDLPTSPNVSRLRAMGVISPASTSVVISFGEGENALRREIKIAHLRTGTGRALSFFVCPECRGLARFIRLYERPRCRRCCLRAGVAYRIWGGSSSEKAEARRVRIEKLRKLLAGGPARLKPSPPGRTLDRRRSLELSLRRALIAERRDQLKGIERWAGTPTR
jgi:hypothetical protein